MYTTLSPVKNTLSPKGTPQRAQPQDTSTSPKRIVINPKSPATQFGMVAGTILRHQARDLGVRVLPDGFVRVSEILRHNLFGKLDFNELEYFVKNDPKNRFELRHSIDLMGGKLERVWWMRATYGHTMPGVDFATRRVIHTGKLGTVYYITSSKNWEYIREHGIPSGPDYLIQLFNISPFNNIFFNQAPDHGSAVRISIDTKKAVNMGIKFFHTQDVQLFASGGLDETIPLEAFKSVCELEFTTESLS